MQEAALFAIKLSALLGVDLNTTPNGCFEIDASGQLPHEQFRIRIKRFWDGRYSFQLRTGSTWRSYSATTYSRLLYNIYNGRFIVLGFVNLSAQGGWVGHRDSYVWIYGELLRMYELIDRDPIWEPDHYTNIL